MQKKVVGVLETFYDAQAAVKEASADNEIMADRAVVILRRYGAAEIDERPEEDPAAIRPA